MASLGRSGGILLGADLNHFDIGAIDEGDFYAKFLLRDKSNGFKFMLYMVYGSAQTQDKEAFLVEMANTCSHETLPYIIGGDFNIMRKAEDKSTNNFDTKWPTLFNAVIELLDLREISLSGRQYTWAGPGDDSTFEKLDRVLVSTEWEDRYPLSTLDARDRNISDHTPLILNTSSSTHQNPQHTFKFERGWLLRDAFYDMVVEVWESKNQGKTQSDALDNT